MTLDFTTSITITVLPNTDGGTDGTDGRSAVSNAASYMEGRVIINVPIST